MTMITPYNRGLIIIDPLKAVTCYGCDHYTHIFHANYVFSCVECGTKFENYRHFSQDLTGHVCIVTGARTKLGHQVVLKLLRAGATVGTTRYPQKALRAIRKITRDL